MNIQERMEELRKQRSSEDEAEKVLEKLIGDKVQLIIDKAQALDIRKFALEQAVDFCKSGNDNKNDCVEVAEKFEQYLKGE